MSSMTHQDKINCLRCVGGQLDEFLSQVLLYLSSDIYKLNPMDGKFYRSEDEKVYRVGAKSIEREGLKIIISTRYELVCLQSLCGIKFTAKIGILQIKMIVVTFFVREQDLLGNYVLPESMQQDDVVPCEFEYAL